MKRLTLIGISILLTNIVFTQDIINETGKNGKFIVRNAKEKEALIVEDGNVNISGELKIETMAEGKNSDEMVVWNKEDKSLKVVPRVFSKVSPLSEKLNTGIGHSIIRGYPLAEDGNEIKSGPQGKAAASAGVSWNQFNTDYGYIKLGPGNQWGAHIYTDMPYFFFNASIRLLSGGIGTYNSDLLLKTGNRTRIFIDQDTGNVGIGTLTPDADRKLHVKGNAKITGDLLTGGKLMPNVHHTQDMGSETSAWGTIFAKEFEVVGSSVKYFHDGTDAHIVTDIGSFHFENNTSNEDINLVIKATGGQDAHFVTDRGGAEHIIISDDGDKIIFMEDVDEDLHFWENDNLHRKVHIHGSVEAIDGLQVGDDGTDGQLTIYSEQGETDYSVVFQPNAAMTQNTTYTLPADDGNAGQILTTNASGGLSWESLPSGADDLGDHTATQDLDMAGFEINLNGGYLSGDGDDEGVYIAADGKVGIGTASPTEILDVAGNIAVSGTVDGIDIATDVAANTAKVTNAIHTGDVTGSTALTIGDDKILEAHLNSVNDPTDEYTLTYEVDSGNFEWQASPSGADNLGDHTATQDLDMAGFEVNLNGGYLSGDGDDEGVYVSSDGKVGIGTTSPDRILDVEGDGSTLFGSAAGQTLVKIRDDSFDELSIGSMYVGHGSDGGAYFGISRNNSGNFKFFTQTNDSWQQRLIIENNGNVGIGTKNPDELLQVAGNMRLDGTFEDKDGDAGTAGQILSSTATGTDWIAVPSGSDNLGDHTATQDLDMAGFEINLNGGYLSGDGDDEGVYVDSVGNVGIGTAAPAADLNINGVDGLLVQGTYASGIAQSLGAGTRLHFYSKKAAFRAGYADGTNWDDANIGNYSTALGYDTRASGFGSTALGISTLADAVGATALGHNTRASGDYSTALGSYTTASGDYSTALGSATTASGDYSTALGQNTKAQAYSSFAIGKYNVGSGSADSWVDTDPLFEIGIGASSGSKANAMTVLKSGKVGIGTASPTEILDVVGNIAVSGTVDGIDIATDVAANTAKVTDDDYGVTEVYGIGWNDDQDSPTKNDVYDKIESLGGGGGADNLGDHTATQNIQLSSNWLSGDGDNEGVYIAADGKVGIGTAAPAANLNIAGDDGLLVQGTFGSGIAQNLGLGTRLHFYSKKSAFRAGYVDGTNWDNANIGTYSTAFGYDTKASGETSIALGTGTTAIGMAATALGEETVAGGDASTALGILTSTGGYGSTAMGFMTTANGDYSTAMGILTSASGEASTTLGQNTKAQAYSAFAIGKYNVGGGSYDEWVNTDPLFEIGIGASSGSKANAMTVLKSGKVGIGTATPDELLQVAGNMRLDGTFEDKDGDAGTAGQILSSTATGTDWIASQSGLDDQTIDVFSISGNNVQLSLEDDGEATKTVDISSTTAVAANTAKVTDDDDGVAEVYGIGWNADTDSPTKNDVYDKIELLGAGGDDLGNHTATQDVDMAGFELKLNGGYLSGDGDDEGVYIDSDGNVGIGTASPTAKLHVSGNDGLLVQGTYASGIAQSLGTGTRLHFYSKKGAFRAGYVAGTNWDADSIGNYSTALGYNTRASGDNSTALGYNTKAIGETSTALGYNTRAIGYYSTALGYGTSANMDGATAMGWNTSANEAYSTALGLSTTADGQASTALGYQTKAQAYLSFVIGRYNVSGGDLTAWENNDPLFEIGIGASSGSKANAMTVLKSGKVGIGTASPTELLDIDSDAIRIRSSQTPASATATGTAGMIAWDADYIYVCTATDTWKRTAISTW